MAAVVVALVAALVAAVVAVAVVAVVAVVGIGRASNHLTDTVTPQPGRPAGYHGPGYPGMLVHDRVANGPGSLDILGETLTAERGVWLLHLDS